MDDGCEGHKEAYFAMYGAKMRVSVPVKPDYGGCDSGDCRQQKRPPQNARDGVFVLCETREPVAASVMKVNVIAGQDGQGYPQCDVYPYRPGVFPRGYFQLYGRCQCQNE